MNERTELRGIVGTQNKNRTADIIFVHGLGGDALGTWHPEGQREANSSWLTWLGEDFNNIGIWSVAYEVEPFRWRGSTMPLADRATNIVDLLEIYDIGERPLIFITHSMGGLVVKQLLRHACDYGNPSWGRIVEQTKGIVFLSTPHSGSDIANWVQYIGGILGTSVSVEELRANDPQLRQLNIVYRNHDQLSKIPITVYCENERTSGIMVVDQTSADPGRAGVIPIPLDENHITIARPQSKESRLYIAVKKFIKNCLPDLQPLPALEPQESPEENSETQRNLNRRKFFYLAFFGCSALTTTVLLGKDNILSSAKSFTEDLGTNINLEMIAIPGGQFLMGSSKCDSQSTKYECPQRKVKIQPFYMGKFEVTQEQWQAVMGNNPSYNNKDNPSNPVEQVTWYDAQEFCDRLSQKTGKEYRLPTEAEWEYACRAGTTTAFHFGETINPNLVNYGRNEGETTPVGNYPPNNFDLHDMHGNVFEWCEDIWHENYNNAPTDGSAWMTVNSYADETKRVARGGSWNYGSDESRSARRGAWLNSSKFNHSGFRVVCSIA